MHTKELISIIPFDYSGTEIRTIMQSGDPWWVAKDVCSILGLTDARKSVNILDDDERNTIPVTDALGRDQDTLIINEPGLYSLIIRSRKPEAKKFKRWITHEVIPSIRKTGTYQIEAPKSLSEALRLAADLEEERERLQLELTEAQPKALFADAVSASETSILVGELAKLLRQNGVDMGQNRLFTYLRDSGYLIKRKGQDYNLPTQYSMERGWFEIRERTVVNSDGSTKITKTTKVTGKGQVFFINKLLSA